MAANVVKETEALRKSTRNIESLSVEGETVIDSITDGLNSGVELEMDIVPGKAQTVGFDIMNAKGEKTKIYLDLKSGRAVMDRTESGLIAFGEKAEPHFKENHDRRKTESINYINDFALGTWAPLSLCVGKSYHLNVFVDKCSVELFVDGGRIAMTNLVFPTEVYNSLRFYTEGGKAEVKNLSIHKLGL